MLGASFPPSQFGILACFGLIPLLIVLSGVERYRDVIKYGYVAMLVFHIITLNWTGGYAHAKDPQARGAALDRLERGLALGIEHGLTVLGGHGLTYRNVDEVASIFGFVEFNIGHSIVSRALFSGLEAAVREMKALIIAARGGRP